MHEPSLEQRMDEVEGDLTVTLTMAVNSHWTSTALACALIDKGLLSKTELLKMLDSLILTASSYAVVHEADPETATSGLERMRFDLEQLELRPGHVLDELSVLEALTAKEAGRYQKLLKRKPSDGDPGASSEQ